VSEVCLIEAKMWGEVHSCASHLLHTGLSSSPTM